MHRARPRLPLPDVLLAGVLAVAAGLSQATDRSLPQPWVSVVAAGWSAALLLRSVAPFAMAVTASVAAVTYAAFPVHTTLLASFVTLLVVGFSVGEHLTGRRLTAAVALLLVSTYVVQIVTATRSGGDTGFGDVYISPLVLMTPVVGGMLLRRSRRQAAELRSLGLELAAERDAHARTAAAEERNRIARELHDVISHSVSVMVVQAGAAEELLPAGSPAAEPLHAVRTTGKEALRELRRQLGVLREDERAAPAPAPALADVAGLVEDAGARLDYDPASVGDIPPGLALAAYRVVQEALTNARRHAAGAPIQVRVGREGDELDLEVVNGPGAATSDLAHGGHGLTGMHERVEMYAGCLEAGATTDGGWAVRARLPVPPAAAIP